MVKKSPDVPKKPSKVAPKPPVVPKKAPKLEPKPKGVAPVAAILARMSKAMVAKMDKAVKDRGNEFNSPFFRQD